MNWIVTIVTLLIVILIGAMFFAMPWLTRPTIPLGVSIPSTRVSEPVVIRAVKRYRIGMIVVTLVAVLVGILGAAFAPLAAALLPIAVILVGTLVVYLTSRRLIQHAKRDGDWYHDVPVRLTATVTSVDRRRIPPALGWYVAAIVVLMAAIVIGAAIYDSLPDPIAVHWNADGVADRFAAKTIWSVFGPILLGIGVVALLFLLAVFMPRWPVRGVASDSPEVSARIAVAQVTLMQGLLGQIAFLIALEFACVAVVGWLAPASPTVIIVSTLVLPLLLLAVIVLFIVRYRRATVAARAGVPVSAGGAGATDAPRPEAPDDDRFWKAGSIYVNRADPALLVPKRFGVGWTVNMGHPAGIALAVITLLIVVGAIVWGVSTRSHAQALGALALFANPLGVVLRNRRAGHDKLVWARPDLQAPEDFTLTSPAFDHGAPIPASYRGRLFGPNISPALAWTTPPAGTAELVLIVQDPDVPFGKPAIHALAVGIDPSSAGIPENGLAHPSPIPGLTHGKGPLGRRGWGGPMPPRSHGPHSYVFQVFALDYRPGLPESFDLDDALTAMRGHVIARARLDGTYEVQ